MHLIRNINFTQNTTVWTLTTENPCRNDRSQYLQTIWYNPLPRRSALLSGGNRGGGQQEVPNWLLTVPAEWEVLKRRRLGRLFTSSVITPCQSLIFITLHYSVVGLNQIASTSKTLGLDKHAMTLAWAWCVKTGNDACVTRTQTMFFLRTGCREALRGC